MMGRFGSGRRGPLFLALLPALLLGATFVVLLLVLPELRREFQTGWELLWNGEPEPVKEWLLSFGVWAALVSGLLQLATSIFPPGPSFLLGIANAMVFGIFWGGLLTLCTQFVAAAACFGIARVVGRPGVARLVSAHRLQQVDGFMERKGVLAVFVGRIIPFVNPDLVSYAAGVTGIRWPHFLAAVTLGAVPSTIFYSIIGGTAMEASGWIIGMVGVASIVPLILLAVFRKRFNAWLQRFEQSPPS